jgi:hypothetical protein
MWLRKIKKDDTYILMVTFSTTFLLGYTIIFTTIGISFAITSIFLGLVYAGYGKNFVYK